MTLLPRLLLLLGVLAASGCARRPESPPPQREPQQQPRPQPPPLPPPPVGWADMALTPGTWLYRQQPTGSQAMFGAANSEAQLLLRCDRARRQVVMSREGTTTGNTMTVRTSYGARSFPVSVQAEPLAYVFVMVAAGDPFLDQIAFSRGRFTVDVPGLPTLVVPAWPEAARVVEDCRS